jgi:uncharacterized protein YfaS (alpha-2-macroglobulin family)
VPERWEPDTPLPIRIHAPGARRARIAVVDAGLLARTRHPAPDPWPALTAPRALAGLGAGLAAVLLDRPRFALVPGGDRDNRDASPGAVPGLRGDEVDLRQVALAATVDLDADGRGAWLAPLPSFEGRLRISAVTAGATAAAGAAADTVVAGAVGLRAAGPRLLAPGDRTRVAVTAVLRGHGGSATLAAVARGGLAGGATVALVLEPDRPHTIDLPVEALAEGPAELALTLAGPAGTRAILWPVTVRPARRPVVLDVLAGPGTWRPDPALAGTAALVVSAPRDGVDRLAPALDRLVDWPHGCGEQTAGRVLALAAAAAADDPLAPGRLAHGLTRLHALLGPEGIPWWPGGPGAPVPTLSAAEAVVAAGPRAPADLRRALLDRVEDLLQRERDPGARARAVEILAAGGRPVRGWLDRLVEQTGPAAVEERCRFALAAAAAGDPARARELLADLALPAPATAAARTDPWLRSPLRTAAVELRARLAVDPGHPRVAVLTERLLRVAERPDGATTQELTAVVRALEPALRLAPAEPAAAVTVRMAGAPPLRLAPGATAAIALAPGTSLELDRPLRIRAEGWSAAPPAGSGDLAVVRRWPSHPDGTAAVGAVVVVELEITARIDLDQVLVTDPLPAGWEPVGDLPAQTGLDLLRPAHQELRDDRWLAVLGRLPAGTSRLRYAVRAVRPGIFTAAPPSVEAFYVPDATAVGEPRTVEVR